MRIEKIYQKGSADINEDTYVINENQQIYAVIDGATGLGGLSGSIASNIIASALNEEDGDLLEKIKKGNVELGKRTVLAVNNPAIKKIEDVPKTQRSTCGLSAIRLVQEPGNALIKMDYVAAADCMIFIQYENGQIRQVSHDYMEIHDSKGIRLQMDLWETILVENEDPNTWEHNKMEMTKKNIYERVQPLLKQNRNKLNAPDGYGIIDGSDEAPLFLESGTIPLMNVKGLLLLSDGLKLHTHRNGFQKNEWLNSAETAFEFGLDYLLEKMTELEKNDAACYEFPRFKQYDDKTGILIYL